MLRLQNSNHDLAPKQCATRNSENRKPPEIVHFNDDNDDSAVRESSTFMFSAVRDRAELK